MDKKETFKAKGYWIENKPYSIDGHWDINYSDILSQLIKSAGKYCKRYASDLFIDWKAIDSLLEEGTPINRTWIFAIRENGVDHKEFYEISERSYFEVWELYIKTDTEDREIKMTLTQMCN